MSAFLHSPSCNLEPREIEHGAILSLRPKLLPLKCKLLMDIALQSSLISHESREKLLLYVRFSELSVL